jgi:DNA-directed RNA polymerase subunit RPC12/RpoP
MTLKCSGCGSLNVDSMTACGNCGAALTQADRVVAEKIEESPDEPGMACPYCGGPMEKGLLEIPAHQILSPLWLSGSGEEALFGYGASYHELEGYRCRSCNCLLVDY